MTANPPRKIDALIEASSLGTPEAAAMRASVSDETARSIVARSEALGPVPTDAGDEERIRYEIGRALVISGALEDDDPDAPEMTEWHHCFDQPACRGATTGCPCAGVPYVSRELWAELGPVIAKIRDAGRAAGRTSAAADPTITNLAIAYVNAPDGSDDIPQIYHELQAAVRHLEAVNRAAAGIAEEGTDRD